MRNVKLSSPEIMWPGGAHGSAWQQDVVLDTEGESRRYILIFQGNIPEEAKFAVRLAARGARAEVAMVFLGRDATRASISVTVSHEAPDTFSRVLCKSVLWDKAKLDFSGMLRIAKNADGSDAYLGAHARLLSPGAMARIDPQLEILASDVKASHGSTVGRLSESDLFYLQSRGLERESAQRVSLTGYLRDVFALMPQQLGEKLKALL